MNTLSDREKQVLVAVIGAFLSSGNPVASAQVAKSSSLGVSSATIRNTMLALERRGLLEQPHTSAGRRPTLEALRIYAQELRPLSEVPPHIELRIQQAASRGVDAAYCVRAVAQVLGTVTPFAALASPPDRSALKLAHIRLLGLTPHRVLVLVVTEDGGVTNHPVELDEEVDPPTLTRMENYLSEILTGLHLDEAATTIRTELDRERARYDALVSRSLALGRGALCAKSESGQVLVEGESNLLTLDALDAQSVRDLGVLLREKGALLRILDGLRDAKSTQVVIGVSNGPGEEREGGASLVLAPYAHGSATGWVGVLGPTRMQYGDIIPIVEAAASAVGSTVKDSDR